RVLFRSGDDRLLHRRVALVPFLALPLREPGGAVHHALAEAAGLLRTIGPPLPLVEGGGPFPHVPPCPLRRRTCRAGPLARLPAGPRDPQPNRCPHDLFRRREAPLRWWRNAPATQRISPYVGTPRRLGLRPSGPARHADLPQAAGALGHGHPTRTPAHCRHARPHGPSLWQ